MSGRLGAAEPLGAGGGAITAPLGGRSRPHGGHARKTRRPTGSRIAALGLVLAAGVLALPATAGASPNQRSILQDDARVLRSGPEAREATLDELKALGVDTLKLTVSWRGLAPSGRTRPSGFAADDPAAYAGWEPYDAAVAEAARRGLEVFLQVAGPAPDWATGGRSDPPGVLRPDPVAFGAFVEAVGRRYSGSYGGLPRVGLWSVWNEPNLPRYLLPQRTSSRARTPVSPHLYRRLYETAHAGLVASGHGADVILLGELLPIGRNATSSRSSLRPLEFLREMACVDRRLRAIRGRAARSRGCSRYRALPTRGVAHHPYTPPAGPGVRPRSRDDVTIGTLDRLVRELDRLGRRRRLPRGLEVWVTEFGFQTDPPDTFGAPLRRVPGFMAESEWIAAASSRVGSWSQYPLVDDELSGEGVLRFGGFQSGLRLRDGSAKPGVYAAYERPLWVRDRGRGRVTIFGAVRAGDGSATPARLESRLGAGAWRTVATARLGPRGYFTRTVRLSRVPRRTFRFRWGDGVSRTTRAARR